VRAATTAQIVRPPCRQNGHAAMTGMLKMIAVIAVALSQILIATRATCLTPMGALLVLYALMLCVLAMVSNFAMAMGIVILLERVHAMQDTKVAIVEQRFRLRKVLMMNRSVLDCMQCEVFAVAVHFCCAPLPNVRASLGLLIVVGGPSLSLKRYH
jgi:hypothetical protein